MKFAFALTFVVLLDGQPVGTHYFVLTEEGDKRRLVSSARFDVKVLGLPVYRYRHDAVEQWRGECLVKLEARTEDGNEVTTVDAAPGHCTMSFAYWNPRILQQKELLNAQTGRLESIAVSALGDGRYRISGTKYPIELAYSPQGEWLGLESTVAGNRRLTYRRQ